MSRDNEGGECGCLIIVAILFVFGWSGVIAVLGMSLKIIIWLIIISVALYVVYLVVESIKSSNVVETLPYQYPAEGDTNLQMDSSSRNARVEPKAITEAELQDIKKAFKGKRVIVVDDETYLREFCKETLESVDCEVIPAEDGIRCLNILSKNKNKIDAITLDLMMPGMDGLEVLKSIKQNPNKFGNPLIIILTNMTSERVIIEAYNIGTNTYLVYTDIQKEDLIRAVRYIISFS